MASKARFLVLGVGLTLAGEAVAQLRQPRCGGWPPDSGLPGLVIGSPGSACYGALLAPTQFGIYEQLTGAQVRRITPGASFQMLNDYEFSYSPSSGQHRPDEIEIALTWRRGEKVDVRIVRLKGYTHDRYREAGGTSTSPPPGETVGRPLGTTQRVPR